MDVVSNPLRSSVSARARSPVAASSAGPRGSANETISRSARSAVVEAAEPGLDDLDQPVRGDGGADEPPDPPVVAQRAVVEAAHDELPEEQGVSLAADGQADRRRRVHRATQDRAEQILDDRGAQTGQLETLGQTVLPEADDRVGGRLTAPDRGQEKGVVALHHLVDQRGRGVVEEVGVVHQQHETPALGPLHERAGQPAQQLGPAVDHTGRLGAGGGEQRREGPERQGSGRAGGRDPDGGETRLLRQLERFETEARLADTGGAGQYDSLAVPSGHEGVELGELVGSPDQGPVSPHGHSVARRSRTHEVT